MTEERVRYIANLARLALSDEEVSRMREELGTILSHMRELDAIPTEGAPPTAHAVPMASPEREDVEGRSLPREEVLAVAPRAVDGGFAVPRVLELPE